MTGDDSDSQGWVPVPDPTERTRLAAAAEAAQLRRELAAAVATINVRLDAMDAEWERHLEFAKEIRPQTERLVGHLKDLHDERFRGIDQRFTDRDARAKDAAIASKTQYAADMQAGKEALKAALESQKEIAGLVGKHNEAEVEALKRQAAERDKSVDTQFKGLEMQISTINNTIAAGIPVGFVAGERAQKGERRQQDTLLISVLSVVVFVLGIVLSTYVATHR